MTPVRRVPVTLCLSSLVVTVRTAMTLVRRVAVMLCFIITGWDCEDDYDACVESPCDVTSFV